MLAAVLTLALAAVIVTGAAISTDTLGAGRLFDRAVAKVDRFLAGPVPERSAPATVLVTDPPEASDVPEPTATPGQTATTTPGASGPTLTPVPVATATPAPARVPVDIDIVVDHKAVFAHEIKDTWCASAGVQMTLAVLGLADNSNAFQRKLQGRVREWESYDDSHNGDWGPSAMALALDAYGAKGYEVRAYQTRQGALRDAAKAIERTGSPVLLMAWRGAHTWVMTGFRADADPLDLLERDDQRHLHPRPVVPGHLEHLGPVRPARDVPGQRRDGPQLPAVEATRGPLPDRDGLFIAVVPTIVVKPVE